MRIAPKRLTLAAPPADPFGEHRRARYSERVQLLGAQFHFESDSPRLLRMARLAYARLPPHRFSGALPRLQVRVMLTAREHSGWAPLGAAAEPPAVRTLAAGGILCGALGGAALTAIVPRERTALVVVPQDLMRHPYHIRYELLEFAVYVLAARVQQLVPLHAACVGRTGEGILLMGASGAGKSTLVVQCLLGGLDFLAEDSVLVRPRGLLATGVSNFLHLRPDSLRFLDKAERALLLRESCRIRRRSGVEKLEIDLRRPYYHLAPSPLRVRAVAFLSRRNASAGTLLTPLRNAVTRRRLADSQRYAAHQPGWGSFTQQLAKLPAYELRRGAHPRESVEALRELLTAMSIRQSAR